MIYTSIPPSWVRISARLSVSWPTPPLYPSASATHTATHYPHKPSTHTAPKHRAAAHPQLKDHSPAPVSPAESPVMSTWLSTTHPNKHPPHPTSSTPHRPISPTTTPANPPRRPIPQPINTTHPSQRAAPHCPTPPNPHRTPTKGPPRPSPRCQPLTLRPQSHQR